MTLVQTLAVFHARVAAALQLDAKPWRQWLVVYSILLVYFLVYRCLGLSAMLKMFGVPSERSSANRVYAIVLGSAEDFLLVTLLLVLLSLVDLAMGPASTTHRVWLRRSVRFVLHALLLVVVVASFAADLLLIRSRELRFTFEFITTYVREFKFTAGFEVDPREVRIAKETVAITIGTVVLLLAVTMLWLDLSQWHLANLFVSRKPDSVEFQDDSPVKVENGENSSDSCNDTASPLALTPLPTDSSLPYASIAGSANAPALDPKSRRVKWLRVLLNVAIPVAILFTLSTVLLLITHAVPAVVSATALNDSLNELFRLTLDLQFLKDLGDGTIEAADLYLDPTTETYELFKTDVLFRKTTGFKGPLAFDVTVNQSSLPNVLVIAVESFRYQDSLYIVGNKSLNLLQKQGNVTLSPAFDRWAQRGVAMRNFWSSWQTSRSVEGILFGQVAYDHVSDSGTTTGRRKVQLNGMPQFFHAKGFETQFTTGARLNYDGWDKFFRPHGFDDVVGAAEIRKYAQHHYNISVDDWKQPEDGGQGRGLFWGVHDDVSFQYLGDVMLNKTAVQQARVRKGEAKTPFFINHYTISSHTPWEEHPAWFDNTTLPDFSGLTEHYGEIYGDTINHDKVKNYAKMRYFTDLQLGRFLDRMQREGVLNDTVVVITGDHGQSPEESSTRVYEDETTTMRVPAVLIAEGRLANYSGLVLDDAAHHYDLLNTLADIMGVPEGGFLQSGVGRSLKRAVSSPDQRPVWSNNPMRGLSIVRGHERLSYDRVFSRMGLYNVETDPMLKQDLLPGLDTEKRREWDMLRERGRRLSRYFRVRWDEKCISKVEC